MTDFAPVVGHVKGRDGQGNRSEITIAMGKLPPVDSTLAAKTATTDPMIMPVLQHHYLVDGELLTWDGPMQSVPSALKGTGVGPSTLGEYPMLGAAEATAALHAAVNAYDHGLGSWPTVSVEERISCVEAFLGRMIEHKPQMVQMIMWEIGKTLPDAVKEFDRTVEYVRESIDDLRVLTEQGKQVLVRDGVAATVERSPVGVGLCMGPFNYPLNETFTTLIPALLMGNTVVFKPPKLGVLLLEPLLEAFQKSFPPGVINAVYGDGKEVITPIMESGSIDLLAFIGSSKVAALLMKQHPAPHRLKVVLGLGAKNPGIVLPDADVDSAVKEALVGALSYNGQRCTALKVLFVHRSIANEFTEKFSAGVNALKRGLPWEEGVKITPLAEEYKPAYLRELIEDAVAQGARVTNDGGGTMDGGVFHPAVLYPASAKMRVYKEEQFGPVTPIIPFDDPNEVIALMKASEFGQQASIFGSDPEQLRTLAEKLGRLTCRVNINTQCQRGPDNIPFAGRKDSAMGTLDVRNALLAFSVETVKAVKEKDPMRAVVG